MHWAKNDLHEDGLDRYLGTWLHSRIGKNYSHNRAAKHKNLLSSSRVITKITCSWPWWMLPQAFKDIYFSPCLSCPCFLAERACWIDISMCIHKHSGMPGYEKTHSTAQVYNLTSNRFWLNLAIVKNSQLTRYRSPAMNGGTVVKWNNRKQS